jgi:hypothetical protein
MSIIWLAAVGVVAALKIWALASWPRQVKDDYPFGVRILLLTPFSSRWVSLVRKEDVPPLRGFRRRVGLAFGAVLLLIFAAQVYRNAQAEPM